MRDRVRNLLAQRIKGRRAATFRVQFLRVHFTQILRIVQTPRLSPFLAVDAFGFVFPLASRRNREAQKTKKAVEILSRTVVF